MFLTISFTFLAFGMDINPLDQTKCLPGGGNKPSVSNLFTLQQSGFQGISIILEFLS
jgi:hypothetical protein